MPNGGHTNEHGEGQTISSGSTNEGIVMKTFKEVVSGGGEIISEGTTANMIKVLDSVATDFPPGAKGSGGGGSESAHH
jgi:hypothetical protein